MNCARSNPLTPGTTVRPARYPDQPEPIKLNYQKYNNAHWTRRHSCGGASPRTMKLVVQSAVLKEKEKLKNMVAQTQSVVQVSVHRKERRPRSPGPIDELIAALCEATLGPAHPRHHGLDPLPDTRPRVKIQPPIFKGIPGERPDAHLLATADWMEAM